MLIIPSRTTRLCGLALGLPLLLAACDGALVYDFRGNFGGPGTSTAARNPTANRLEPDSRGVITYPDYQVVVARGGDTAQTIAQRLGTDAAQLARLNGVRPDTPLRNGEILALPGKLPNASGGTVDIASLAAQAIDSAPDSTPPDSTPAETFAQKPATSAPAPTGPVPARHKVKRGETAYTIARLYQVPVSSLAEWNGLGADFAVREDQYLLIPVAAQAPPAIPVETDPGQGSPTPTPPSATQPLPDEQVAPRAESPEPPETDAGEPTNHSARMALPVQGKIIRTYQKGRNDGIDIAGPVGGPVTAAADGSVAAITSDADQIPIIVVRHPGNILTVYANVDGIRVQKGDEVKRGQKLATLREGDNAYVHFEVREGFDSVDPAPYLE